MSFNYRKGVPIARILGGSEDGRLIYLDVDGFIDPIKKLSKKFKDEHNDLTRPEVLKFHKALRSDIPPVSSKLRKIYYDAKQDIKVLGEDCIDIKDGKLQLLPREDMIERLYVSAPSNSGKSYYVGKYLDEYFRMYPDSPYFLYSSVAEDESLDRHDPERIPIDDDLITDPLTLDDMYDSVVVMDDTNTIRNKKYKIAVNTIRDIILERGRHNKTRCIITSHILMNYQDSRVVLNESKCTVVFPKSGTTNHIRNYLKNYVGMSKEQIAKFLKLDSRWIAIYKTNPMYLGWESGLCLLSAF